MMGVIVVSRRVGQVTLAVSERTSCRNLNGLKAIVDMIRSVKAIFGSVKESEQPSSAQPSSRRMSRQAGSIVREISKPRRISVKTGRQQVAAMYCPARQRSRRGEPKDAVHPDKPQLDRSNPMAKAGRSGRARI